MSFKSVLTTKHKSLQCINWYDTYYYSDLNEIYIGFGGHITEWDDDNNPPTPNPSDTEISEFLGISKATVSFIKLTTASGADVVYQDGTYWDRIEPNDPSINDYDNIISEEISHLYVRTSLIYNDFSVNTFRQLTINHNPLKTDGNLCTDVLYENDDVDFDFDATGSLASQGNLILLGNTSKVIMTVGQNLNIGLILKF